MRNIKTDAYGLSLSQNAPGLFAQFLGALLPHGLNSARMLAAWQ
jgi:hypothetical protein